MDTLTSTFVVLTGILLRLIVPLSVTALIVFFLRKLDMRWQTEADLEKKLLVKDEKPCWMEKGLSMDEIKILAPKSETACWQSLRLSNGYLCEKCLDCDVFLSAPIPSPKQKEAHA